MQTLAAVLLLLSLSGCVNLILNDNDSTADRTGKIAARVLLAPITLGMSEVAIHDAKKERDCDAVGGWYFMGACRENSEANRNRAMMLMPGMMQSINQAARPLPPPVVPAQPAPRQPLHCVSRTMGAQTYTDCY